MSIQTRVTVSVVLLMVATVVMAWSMGRSIVELKSELARLEIEDRPDKAAGAVELARMRLDIATVARRSRQVLLEMTLVALFVPTITMLLVVTLLATTFRRVDRQLEAIVMGARQFASGRMDARVPELAKDELGQLAATLNRMMVELGEVTVPRCDLDELKAHLEKTQAALGRAHRFDTLQQHPGVIVHDLNNILAAIGDCASSALESVPEGRSPRQELEAIRVAVGRAVRLIRGIFHGNQEKGGQGPTNLNETIHGLADLLRRNLKPMVELKLDLAPDLWSVPIDSTQAEQVLLNLVVNARDAMTKGGLVTVITRNHVPEDGVVSAPPQEEAVREWVVLEVRDTGPGLGEGVKSRIFEPFFTTKGPGKGTGIGLSICRGLIQQAGGTISVESSAGKGALFRTLLPRHGSRPGTPERSAPAAHPARGTESVLLLVDEPAVRRQSARILAEQGYRVEEFDFESAPESASPHAGPRVDLVLVDLDPAREGHRELVDRLRIVEPEARTLILAAPGGEVAWPGGEAAFLHKPFLPGHLARAVRATLDGSTGRIEV